MIFSGQLKAFEQLSGMCAMDHPFDNLSDNLCDHISDNLSDHLRECWWWSVTSWNDLSSWWEECAQLTIWATIQLAASLSCELISNLFTAIHICPLFVISVTKTAHIYISLKPLLAITMPPSLLHVGNWEVCFQPVYNSLWPRSSSSSSTSSASLSSLHPHCQCI